MTCTDDCERIELTDRTYDDFNKTGKCPDCGNDQWEWYYADHKAFFKCKQCHANFETHKSGIEMTKTNIYTHYIVYDKRKIIKYFYAVIRRGKGEELMNVDDDVLHDISAEEIIHIIKESL